MGRRAAGGPTALQRLLVHAVLKSMTGGVPATHLNPRVSPVELRNALRGRDVHLRTRVVHLMLLAELTLRPLPGEVEAKVERYAEALGVEDGMIAVTRSCAAGALGELLDDFDRNGYTATWEPGRTAFLHTSVARSEPWRPVANEPALAQRWASLACLPADSLGAAVHRLYLSRGFSFPGSPGSVSPYLAQHDWVHVVADYGTTLEGELEVFGLIARAIPDPRGFSLLAMAVSLFETGALGRAAGVFEADPGHLSTAGMTTRLADAMRRGALCGRDLMAEDWFALAPISLVEVRQQLGLPAKSRDAVACGSVGPWTSRGITPNQSAAAEVVLARSVRRPRARPAHHQGDP